MIRTLPKRLFDFGPFRLDPVEHTLLKEGRPVTLAPRIFDLLTVLVESSGHLFEKEDLLKAVWSDSFVEEGNLTRNISTLRAALGQTPDGAEYIETVPKRGYRFVAPVREVNGSADSEQDVQSRSGSAEAQQENGHTEVAAAQALSSINVEVAPSVSGVGHWLSKTRIHKRSATLATAGVVIAIAVFGYYFYFAKSAEPIDSVAVLPFVNASNDPNAEYLADGISDTVIDSLSQLPNLKRVVPHSSVLRFKGKQIDPQAVGWELNARAVLTGRLTQRGEDLLISTELIDVKDNTRLWGGQYNRKLADITKLQGEIAKEISEKLRLKLSGEQKQQLTRVPTESAEAYQLYLQGRYYRSKGTDEARVKSNEYFQQAIEKDQNYALGYAGLAHSYGALANFGQMPPKEAWRKSEEAAVKALAIDDTLPEVHVSLASVKIWYDWDWSGAEREFKRAIELNTKVVEAHALYAYLLQATGRFDEAIAEAKRATELDHSRAFPAGLLYQAGRYDEAIDEFHKALANGSDRGPAYLGLGEIYLKLGKNEEALAQMLKARPLVNQPRQLARIGYVYAVAGKRDDATKILDEVKASTRERYNLGTHIAAIYGALGNKDEAFLWLNRACDDREFGVVDLKSRPSFDTLRSDPRFTDLLRRVKLAP